MREKDIIAKTAEFVRESLADAEGGHDWWHIYRVWRTAKALASYEKVDPFVVELGALLHDIADSKFYGGDEKIGPRKAKEFLEAINVDKVTINDVVQIVTHVSFKGEKDEQKFNSKELDVVQDADRLDALGAIGIGRAFNYGGHQGRAMHDPGIQPRLNMTKDEYKSNNSSTVNHFYEKLFLLKDRMNTVAGRRMAEERHEFMEKFIERFYGEWEGEL